MSIDRSDSFSRAGGREVLPIRTRHIGCAEERGKRLALLSVHEYREGAAVGLLA
jgi:hypothetical protein